MDAMFLKARQNRDNRQNSAEVLLPFASNLHPHVGKAIVTEPLRHTILSTPPQFPRDRSPVIVTSYVGQTPRCCFVWLWRNEIRYLDAKQDHSFMVHAHSLHAYARILSRQQL
eukprot:gene6472-9348_t